MSDKPLVSVIMPTYNCGKYISESIDSVLNQTLKDFELIIVDDNTEDIAKEYWDYVLECINNK